MENIKIYIDKRRDFPYPVYLSIYRKRKRFLIPTGIKCETDIDGTQWGKKEPNQTSKNRKILRLYSMALDILNDTKPDATNDELRSTLLEKLNGEKKCEMKFIDCLDEFMDLKTRKGTKELYTITRNKIIEFDKNATLETIDKAWLTNFENHYLKTMSVNGLAIHLRNIRAVFNHSIDQEYTNNYPFRKFKIRREETRKRNLTVEKLREIRDCKCYEWQERYRDIFMLMVYLMGINAQDLFLLPKGSIRDGRLTYHRLKTNRLYDICVPPEAMQIINRYKGKKYLLDCMDTYSSAKDFLHHMNDALKTLGMEYQNGKKPTGTPICAELTTYYSRHTFGTLAAQKDIPKETIAACLGHSSSSVTDIYINFDTSKIDHAQRLVIDYINEDKNKGQ